MKTEAIVNEHYGKKGLLETIKGALKLNLGQQEVCTVDDLAPIDEFHTRGRESTQELATYADILPSSKVLDVGCGLGGTARYLAALHTCHVTGLDLTHEYVEVGNVLTEMVGMSDQVQLVQGSALQLPFEAESFDMVWTEHVQMNIQDKQVFYRELNRVLKPGGTLLFHDIFRGPGEAPFYPTPWAENELISFLVTEDEARTHVESLGLVPSAWITKLDESILFFETVLTVIEKEGPPPLGIHLLMGANAKTKLKNYLQGMREKRLSVAMGVYTKPT